MYLVADNICACPMREHRTGCQTPTLDRNPAWVNVHVPSINALHRRAAVGGAPLTGTGGGGTEIPREGRRSKSVRPARQMAAIASRRVSGSATSTTSGSIGMEISSSRKIVAAQDTRSGWRSPSTAECMLVSADGEGRPLIIPARTAENPRGSGHTRAEIRTRCLATTDQDSSSLTALTQGSTYPVVLPAIVSLTTDRR